MKTVKGFISAVKKLESNTTMCLKGYDELSTEQQLLLGEMCASLGNLLGDFEEAKPSGELMKITPSKSKSA